MAPRIIQNFSGHRALVVATLGSATGALETTLSKFGVCIERPPIVDGHASFDIGSLQVDRDILFIDGDMDSPLVLDVERGKAPPVPIIGLVGVEAPSRLKSLLNMGATAFLRKPVYGGAVYTAMFVGVNQFLQRRELEAELEDLRDRRRRRNVVVKAIVLLMQQEGLSDEEAYSRLRQESMRSRRGLEDYCEELVCCLQAASSVSATRFANVGSPKGSAVRSCRRCKRLIHSGEVTP